MGRKPRIWHPGVAYHVTGRGNQRAKLFKDDLDYEVFLSIMSLANQKIPGYGLAYVSRYIHNNPVVAQLTESPAAYPWSSYPQYLTDLRKTSICPVNVVRILKLYKGKAQEKRQHYRRFVEE